MGEASVAIGIRNGVVLGPDPKSLKRAGLHVRRVMDGLGVIVGTSPGRLYGFLGGGGVEPEGEDVFHVPVLGRH